MTSLFYFQIVKVTMSPDSMDSFVFCIANKKTAARLVKEMSDIVSLSS